MMFLHQLCGILQKFLIEKRIYKNNRLANYPPYITDCSKGVEADIKAWLYSEISKLSVIETIYAELPGVKKRTKLDLYIRVAENINGQVMKKRSSYFIEVKMYDSSEGTHEDYKKIQMIMKRHQSQANNRYGVLLHLFVDNKNHKKLIQNIDACKPNTWHSYLIAETGRIALKAYTQAPCWYVATS